MLMDAGNNLFYAFYLLRILYSLKVPLTIDIMTA